MTIRWFHSGRGSARTRADRTARSGPGRPRRAGAATLGASWSFNDHVAIEGWGAVTQFDHRVSTSDGKIATASSQAASR